MQRNIKLLILINSLSQAYFWLGNWIFYYLRFTDYAGVGLIMTVYLVTGFVLEIPTGAIADLIGKKKTLVLALFIYGYGNFFLAGAQSYVHLLIGIFLLGTGGALSSGTYEAILYDSLKESGKEKEYGKYLSSSHKYALITMAGASFIGGYLYQINVTYPLIAVGLFSTLSGLLTFLLNEPHIDTYRFNLKKYFLQNFNGFRELSRNVSWKKILPILLICSFSVILTEAIDPNLSLSFGLTATQLGWLNAIVPIVSAIGAHYYTKIKSFFGSNMLTLLIWTLFILSIIISPIAGSMLGVTFILLRSIFYEVPGTISSEVINHSISSSNRATTLSTFSFIERIPYISTSLFIGYSTDVLGAKYTSFVIGILFVVIASTAYLLNINKNYFNRDSSL